MARILICDDSIFMRATIAGALRNAGHEIVGEASEGKEAVEKFIALKPDLVTMDLLMKSSGTVAIRKIMSLDRSARILIISALEDQQAEIIEGIRLGAKGYVNKPIKREVLIKEAERVLGSG